MEGRVRVTKEFVGEVFGAGGGVGGQDGRIPLFIILNEPAASMI